MANQNYYKANLRDLQFLLMANAGVLHRAVEPDAWRRHLALLVEGLAAG